MTIRKDGADWEALTDDFRQGMQTQDLCTKYDISRQALNKGLRQRGLLRTPDSVAKARATRKADEQALRDAMMPVNLERVEAMAEVGAAVLTRHRRQLLGSQQLLHTLKRQLNEAAEKREEIEESLIQYFGAQVAQNPTAVSAIRQQMSAALGAISLPAHAKALANLIQVEDRLIAQERKSYRLDDEGDGKGTYEDYLKEMHEKIIARQKEQRQLALQNEGVASQN